MFTLSIEKLFVLKERMYNIISIMYSLQYLDLLRAFTRKLNNNLLYIYLSLENKKINTQYVIGIKSTKTLIKYSRISTRNNSKKKKKKLK